LKRLLWSWLILAAAVFLTTALMPGIEVTGGLRTYLWISAVFSVVTFLLGPILRLLGAPLMIMTIGLFSFVINAVLFLVTDWLVDELEIDTFMTAIVGAIVLSIIRSLTAMLVEPRRTKHAAKAGG